MNYSYLSPPILPNCISIYIESSRIFSTNLRSIIQIIDKIVSIDQFKTGSCNRVLIINIFVENTNWLKLIFKVKSGEASFIHI